MVACSIRNCERMSFSLALVFHGLFALSLLVVFIHDHARLILCSLALVQSSGDGSPRLVRSYSWGGSPCALTQLPGLALPPTDLLRYVYWRLAVLSGRVFESVRCTMLNQGSQTVGPVILVRLSRRVVAAIDPPLSILWCASLCCGSLYGSRVPSGHTIRHATCSEYVVVC